MIFSYSMIYVEAMHLVYVVIIRVIAVLARRRLLNVSDSFTSYFRASLKRITDLILSLSLYVSYNYSIKQAAFHSVTC